MSRREEYSPRRKICLIFVNCLFLREEKCGLPRTKVEGYIFCSLVNEIIASCIVNGITDNDFIFTRINKNEFVRGSKLSLKKQ